MCNLKNITLPALMAVLTITSLQAQEKPNVVFVVGTPHYNPKDSMAGLAKQIE